MNNEQITEERFTYFWNLILNNPNRFILINKRQNGGSHQERKKERNNLVERLETSFKLMDLPYERRLNKFRIRVQKPKPSRGFVSIDSAGGLSTTIVGRHDGCTMIIDEMASFKESNLDAISKIWDSLSPETHRLVTFGPDQLQELEEAVVTGVFPSTGLPVQPTSLHSPIITDTFLPPVKLITSAIRDSVVTPNILR